MIQDTDQPIEYNDEAKTYIKMSYQQIDGIDKDGGKQAPVEYPVRSCGEIDFPT